MPELGALPNLGFAHLAGVDPLTINNFIVPELHQSGISNSLFVLVHLSALPWAQSPRVQQAQQRTMIDLLLRLPGFAVTSHSPRMAICNALALMWINRLLWSSI